MISFVFRSPQCERSRQICKDKDNLSRNDLLHRNTLHTYTTTFIQRGVQEVGLWLRIDLVQNTKIEHFMEFVFELLGA